LEEINGDLREADGDLREADFWGASLEVCSGA
jgi:hypothetical protein